MNKALNILVTGCGGDIGQSIGKILLKCTFTKNLFGIDISDKNAAQFIYPNFSVGLRYTHPDYLKELEKFSLRIQENYLKQNSVGIQNGKNYILFYLKIIVIIHFNL